MSSRLALANISPCYNKQDVKSSPAKNSQDPNVYTIQEKGGTSKQRGHYEHYKPTVPKPHMFCGKLKIPPGYSGLKDKGGV